MHFFFFTSVGVYCNSLCASCDENKLVLYTRLMTYELAQKATPSVLAKTDISASCLRPVFTEHLLCANPCTKNPDTLDRRKNQGKKH